MVLAIGSILTGIAIPSLAGLVARQRSQGAVQRLVATLHQARDEAIKRNGRVVVCKSADALSCSQSAGWEQGWLMFQDRNNNAQADPGEPLIAQSGALPRGLRLRGNGPVANYISYGPNGAARMVSGAFQAGTIMVCPLARGEVPPTRIILSGTGRPRVGPASTADCAIPGTGS